MKNKDIPYKNLSRDYERLYELLKEGVKLAGYMRLSGLEENPFKTRSSLVNLKNAIYPFFTLGTHEIESIDSKPFVVFCNRWDVQYFDIPNKELFNKELDEETDKLPYEKHVDDGQYNDGQRIGFEKGANWAYDYCNSII